MRRPARFAFFLGLSVLAASAWGCKKEASDSVTVENGAASIVADARGFTPSHLAVKGGIPTALIFTRTSDDTCAKEVVFPDLGTKADLPLKTPVTVSIPAGPPRTLTFQCGMGMFKGALVVN